MFKIKYIWVILMSIWAVNLNAATCDLNTMNLNNNVSGSWDINCESINRNGSYAQYYEFSVNEGQEVEISLDSSEDTYLYLSNANASYAGAYIAEDDNSGEGTNSQINTVLDAGTYVIEATTYPLATSGDFNLALKDSNGFINPECTTAINVGDNVSGSWAVNCVSINRNSSYAQYYEFALNEEQQVEISLDSEEDAYLYLSSNANASYAGAYIAEDDNSGEGTNSKINTVLDAGTYVIETTTYNEDVEGDFNLFLEDKGMPNRVNPAVIMYLLN